VKIMGSRSGNFETDSFVIVNSTDADNVAGFNAGSTPKGQGSFTWNPIDERTPSIITNSPTMKIKVLDASTDFDVSTVSSAGLTMTGNLSITTPVEDWNVGDRTKIYSGTPTERCRT
jgi:hypothetical protein